MKTIVLRVHIKIKYLPNLSKNFLLYFSEYFDYEN